jgi:hypothetical protein
MPGIFVSHASADRVLVDPLVETIVRLGCEVPKKEIFYSSGEDTGIPSGSNLNEYLRSKLEKVSIVIAIVSPAFQNRPYCVAELGAAWSVVGKLFPIAIPGMEHSDMQGVLSGMIVRRLDDSAALDELHDLLCDNMSPSPRAKTWGKFKNQWLARLDGYVGQLPKIRVITSGDYDRVTADLLGAREALREAEDKVREFEKKVDLLVVAKSAKEAVEIALPEEEHERFNVLERRAREALAEVPMVVRDAIRLKLRNEEMPWPRSFDDRSEVEEAYQAGFLEEGSSDVTVVPNLEYDEVRIAVEAVERLGEYLNEENRSETFAGWFRSEYGVPLHLSHKRVWEKIFLGTSTYLAR